MAKENFLKYQNGVSANENVDELHSRLQKLLQEGKVEASDVEHDEVDSDISENDSSSDTSSSSDSDPQPEAKRARLYDQKKLFKESESSKDDNDFYGFVPLKD